MSKLFVGNPDLAARQGFVNLMPGGKLEQCSGGASRTIGCQCVGGGADGVLVAELVK
jgi:hypothetical protein